MLERQVAIEFCLYLCNFTKTLSPTSKVTSILLLSACFFISLTTRSKLDLKFWITTCRFASKFNVIELEMLIISWISEGGGLPKVASKGNILSMSVWSSYTNPQQDECTTPTVMALSWHSNVGTIASSNSPPLYVRCFVGNKL